MPTSTAATPYERALNHLALANDTRSTNAASLRALKGMPHQKGCRHAANILLHDRMDGPSGAITVHRLLTSIQAVSDVKARRLLQGAARNGQPAPSGPLRGLSAQERGFLAGVLAMAAANSRCARTR